MKKPFRTVAPEHASDPAVQQAWLAGELPPDPPEPEPTLKGEITLALDILARAGAALGIVAAGYGNDGTWKELRRQHYCLYEQLHYLEQLAENVEPQG